MASLPARACDRPYDQPKAKIISIGGHSQIEKISNTVVAKLAASHEDRGSAIELLYIEFMIYQRLGPHPCITRFLAFNDGRIYLEILQCSLQERLSKMNRSENNPTAVQLPRWSSQILRAFEHIHSQRVFQVDISLRNMLLDWDDNVKLSDFGGSSIDGSCPLVLPAVSYEHPLYRASTPTIDQSFLQSGRLSMKWKFSIRLTVTWMRMTLENCIYKPLFRIPIVSFSENHLDLKKRCKPKIPEVGVS